MLDRKLPAFLEAVACDRLFVVCDEVVSELHISLVTRLCEALDSPTFLTLPATESEKTTNRLAELWSWLADEGATRHSVLILIGGGALLDLGGFAAATYQRGIPFIQIPTTLLSQVDSSVGGKTGINHPLGKNMIGAFYQPQAVIADTATLQTLPPREFSAGLAEVIKYALLGDIDFLARLEQTMPSIMQQEQTALADTISHCCQMKAHIVEQDEKEQGIRALLNLGHTFGHAIETQMGYGNWLHGEAVAAGMVLAARLSEHKGYLKTADTERIICLLQAARLPVAPPEFAIDTWLAHMQHDKKNQAGQIRLVILKRLGQAAVEAGFSREDMAALLQSI